MHHHDEFGIEYARWHAKQIGRYGLHYYCLVSSIHWAESEIQARELTRVYHFLRIFISYKFFQTNFSPIDIWQSIFSAKVVKMAQNASISCDLVAETVTETGRGADVGDGRGQVANLKRSRTESDAEGKTRLSHTTRMA